MNFKKVLFLSALTLTTIPNSGWAQDTKVMEESNVYSQDDLDREEAAASTLQKTTTTTTTETKLASPVLVQDTAIKTISTTKTALAVKPKKVMLTDIRMPEFSTTPAGKAYLKKYKQLPPLRDIFNNPPPRTVYTEMRERLEKERIQKKKQNLKPAPKKRVVSPFKTTFIKFILNLLVSDAHAYDEDTNFNSSYNCNGLVRCRLNSSQTGYFKVYFEDVVYNNCDGTGQGFDDPNLGQIRRDAVCDVLSEYSTLLKINQTNITPDIVVRRNLSPGIPNDGLAVASAFYGNGHNAARADNGTLHRHIVWRQDFTPGYGDFDAYIYVNWNLPAPFSWDVNLPGYPLVNITNTNIYSFKTSLRHQFLHALGFTNRLEQLVNDLGTTWSMNEIQHTTFNEFLYNLNGTTYERYYNFSSGSMMTPILATPVGNPSAWYVNNNGWYRGQKNYVGAPADSLIPLYTNSPWDNYKSLAHFDDSRAASGTNYLMHHQLDAGQTRDLHPQEKLVLCHIGYQVDGIIPCEGATPRANNDIFTTIVPEMCVPFLQNDQSFSGGNLSVQYIEVSENPPYEALDQNNGMQTYTVGINYFSDTNCTVPSQQSDARSIKFLNNHLKRVVLKYSVKDSVSNRISEPASIELNNCSPDPDQLVCNGDFEMGHTDGPQILTGGNQAVSNNRVPFWGAWNSSPDLVFRNRPGTISNNLGQPVPYPHTIWNFPYNVPNQAGNGGATMIDMPNGEGNFAIYACDYNSSQLEQPVTYLRSPVQWGVSYTISAWANVLGYNMYNNTSIPHPISKNVRFRLQNNQGSFTVLDQPVLINRQSPTAPWTLVSSTFTVTQQNSYSSQYDKMVVDFQMDGTARPHYLDNILMKKTTPHLISGTVYSDNNFNGNMDGVEPGIAGVKVGLYNINANPPQLIQFRITSNGNDGNPIGFYLFDNLSIPPSGYYYTAVVQENSFPYYTEPLVNSYLQTFNRARLIPFQNGGSVTDQDFGVTNSIPLTVASNVGFDCNQTPPAGKAKPKTTKNMSAPPCNQNCGFIDLTIESGLPPYTIQWTGPDGFTSQDEDLWNLLGGDYTVTVTDGANQVYTQTFNVQSFVPTTLTQVLTQPTQGNSNGAINLTVSGQGPFTYNWSSPNGFTGSSEDISNLAPGMYTVTVTGINACPKTQTFRIAPPLVVSHTQSMTNGCAANAGSMNLTVSGGIPPYQYTWMKLNNNGGYNVVPDSQNIEDITGLTGGSYKVVIMDSGGLNMWYPVDPNPPIVFAPVVAMNVVTQVTPASLPTYNNGILKVTITGGVGPYKLIYQGAPAATQVIYPLAQTTPNTSYTWSNLVGSGQAYSVFVQDSRQCNIIKENIKILKKIGVTPKVVRNCLGTPHTNIIQANATGGNGPLNYSFYRNNILVQGAGPNSNYIIPSGSGVHQYKVTVTDTQTAQVVTSANVSVDEGIIAPLPTVAVAVSNATNGQSNGSVTVTAAAGLAPYNFTYSPGTSFPGMSSNIHTRSAMAAGNYNVVVRTNFACEASKAFTIKNVLTSTTDNLIKQ